MFRLYLGGLVVLFGFVSGFFYASAQTIQLGADQVILPQEVLNQTQQPTLQVDIENIFSNDTKQAKSQTFLYKDPVLQALNNFFKSLFPSKKTLELKQKLQNQQTQQVSTKNPNATSTASTTSQRTNQPQEPKPNMEKQVFLAQVNEFLGKDTKQIPDCVEYEFSKTLTPGAYDEEVLWVQKFLNQHPRTLVAKDGPGSPGNETRYFGTATKDAVKRFQELFSKKILEPVGLKEPTGIWGPSTISQANKITSLCKKLKEQNKN